MLSGEERYKPNGFTSSAGRGTQYSLFLFSLLTLTTPPAFISLILRISLVSKIFLFTILKQKKYFSTWQTLVGISHAK